LERGDPLADRVVVDLDPGAGTTIVEVARAAMIAAEQCRMLMLSGITRFHFYTLNRAELSFAICHLLGLRAAVGEKAAAA
jgi:5,10-methylenetetrahydrofolate reductase